MTTRPDTPQDYAPITTPTPPVDPDPAARHTSGRHRLMWLMCVAMLLVVAALIATGRLAAGGLIYALGCLAMMGAMMLWMNHGTTHGSPRQGAAGNDQP